MAFAPDRENGEKAFGGVPSCALPPSAGDEHHGGAGALPPNGSDDAGTRPIGEGGDGHSTTIPTDQRADLETDADVRLTHPQSKNDGSRIQSTDEVSDTGIAVLLERVGWSLVALLVGLTSLQAWAGTLVVPRDNWVSVLLVLGSLLAIWRCWIGRTPPGRILQALILAGLAISIALFAASTWWANSGYGTDAAAFDQYAAQLALHGINPYSHSMAPALSLFRVPVSFYTFQLNGSPVTHLSYPAGSFLAYMPLLALGVKTQAANITDLAAWIIGMFLIWRCLPRSLAWAAGLLMSTTIYISFVLGGVTDALFVPFVVIAVWRWDKFGDRGERTLARYIGPIALGLAMTIKQTPWFLLPFLAFGVWIESRRRSDAPWLTSARYAGEALAVFTLVNIPFVAAAPRPWLKGILLPLINPTIPDGQGLVNLTIFDHVGGGNLQLFTLLSLVAYLSALALFITHYDIAKRAWVPLVGASFFFPSRSFGSYLFMLIPAAIVAATTVAPAPWYVRPRWRSWALFLLAVMGTGSLLALFRTSSPMHLSVVGVRSTGEFNTVSEIYVRVSNETDRTVFPHFTVDDNEHVGSFWQTYAKNTPIEARLGPYATRVFALHAPDVPSEPLVTSAFLVDAFTEGPDTVSVSQEYAFLTALNTQLYPDAIDHPVAFGQAVKIQVRLLGPYGRQVHKAGVAVALGQTVYSQLGPYAGGVSINGHTRVNHVVSITDRQGQVYFKIVGFVSQDGPVYFQAWVVGSGGLPYGYSNKLLVQFVSPKS